MSELAPSTHEDQHICFNANYAAEQFDHAITCLELKGKLERPGLSFAHDSAHIPLLNVSQESLTSIEAVAKLRKTVKLAAKDFDVLAEKVYKHSEIIKETTKDQSEISEVLVARIILDGMPPENVIEAIAKASGQSIESLTQKLKDVVATNTRHGGTVSQNCMTKMLEMLPQKPDLLRNADGMSLAKAMIEDRMPNELSSACNQAGNILESIQTEAPNLQRHFISSSFYTHFKEKFSEQLRRAENPKLIQKEVLKQLSETSPLHKGRR